MSIFRRNSILDNGFLHSRNSGSLGDLKSAQNRDATPPDSPIRNANHEQSSINRSSSVSTNLQVRPGTAFGGSRLLANLNRDSDFNSHFNRDNLSKTGETPRRIEGRPPPIPRPNVTANRDQFEYQNPPPENNPPPPIDTAPSEEINGVKITVQNAERPQSARLLTGSIFSQNNDQPNNLNNRPQSARFLPKPSDNDSLFSQSQPVEPANAKGDIIFPKLQTDSNPVPKDVPPPIDVMHNTYSSDSYAFTPSAPVSPQLEAAKRLSKTEKKLIEQINRSLNNFKQSFSRELNKSFRSDYFTSTQELDQFKNELINETQDILKSIDLYSVDSISISNKIGITLDDGAKNISAILSDNEMQQKAKFEIKKDLLSDYSRSLNELCKSYNDNTKLIINKLNTALNQISQEKDKIVFKKQEITRRQRSIKLKYSDLENTAARQKIEMENAQRTAEQVQIAMESITESEDNISSADVYKAIDQEVEQIMNLLDVEDSSDIQDVAKRVSENMADINSGLLADFNDINDAEIMAAQSIRSVLYQKTRQMPMISFMNEETPTRSIGKSNRQ